MRNDSTYLFYDIETTGLNKCFDQVLQFAAIRTDLKLQEIERHEIHVRLNNDIIPSPYAVITHRIGPSQFDKGISELEAIQKIHALLNTPNTISVGYNTLGFDDEFLRFSFYRHLLTPYTHQYANRCGRMDIYPITMLYYLFKKELLQWPEGNLKLENISKKNQLAEGLAHNAMVDVVATLALARKLMADPAMWSFVTGYFQKTVDDDRIKSAESVLHIGNLAMPVGLLVYGKIGAKDSYLAPVVLLGQHLHYKNQALFLRLDTADIVKTKADAPFETTRIFRKRCGEPPLFLPLKERYTALLSEDRQKLMAANQQFLSENTAIFDAIRQYYQDAKYPEHPTRDIDAALYMIDFPSSLEEKLFR
ncbi:MAG: exonuclease domain-containing protein, partial [Gammaproteobacteria bacterium]|nr:exonuclease domain-containing protein [Gammaproteobacteria bacterium]